MNIFVGYSYRERDSWIEDFVFRIVESFGNNVVAGKEIEGEILSEGVKERILASDALLAFVTRRDGPNQADLFSTHRWVTDELAVAIGARIAVVEIRETKVDPQGGVAGDRQRIHYDESARDKLLVELASVLGRWAQRQSRNLRLLPLDVVTEIRPHMETQGFRCTYSTFKDGRRFPEVDAPLVRKEGGLYLMAKHVPPGVLIQIRVQAAGFSWTSDHIDLDSLPVELIKS